jgi:16S rRNA G1207 methylase RsmC
VGFASAPWTVADIGCGAGTQSLATPRTVVLALKAA